MTVGFDRYLRAEWLDRALDVAASGVDAGAGRTQLDAALRDQVSGDQSRLETTRLLTQIWLRPSPEVRPLRDAAVELYRGGHGDPTALHWGMSMAVYPFFGTAADAMGRQLRLHPSFSAPTVLGRVAETYGDRPTVRRAGQRALQNVVDWGALYRRADGEYVGAEPRPVSARVSAWLVAAALLSKRTEASPLDALQSEPALFPFELVPPVRLDPTPLYDVVRQGGGVDIAVLSPVG